MWRLPPVHVARTTAEADELIRFFCEPGHVFGLDIECKPRGWPPGSAPTPLDGLPALLQISSPRAVILVQLQHLAPCWPALPASYLRLCAEQKTVFLGIGLKADIRLLHGAGCEMQARLVDLDEVAYRNEHPSPRAIDKQWGISSLTQALGGPLLPKVNKLQLTNWAKRQLTPAEVEYAANDAFAAGWIASRLYAQASASSPYDFNDYLWSQADLPERKDAAARLLAQQAPRLLSALSAAIDAVRAEGGNPATRTSRVISRTQAELPGLPQSFIRKELKLAVRPDIWAGLG